MLTVVPYLHKNPVMTGFHAELRSQMAEGVKEKIKEMEETEVGVPIGTANLCATTRSSHKTRGPHASAKTGAC